MKNRIILASQSPRRKQLLEWADIEFDVIVADTDETFPPGYNAADAAIYIAKQKALAVSDKIKDASAVIIAADTIVVLHNEIIGKPKDREDAISILKKLSGNSHKVITGVSILKNSGEKHFADITEVEFHALTEEQVIYYVDTYEPYDKAGAYAIQEWIGVTGIKSIKGDFYNVMGLPVSRVVSCLMNNDW